MKEFDECKKTFYYVMEKRIHPLSNKDYESGGTLNSISHHKSAAMHSHNKHHIKTV